MYNMEIYSRGPHVRPYRKFVRHLCLRLVFSSLAQVRDVIFSDRERSLNRNEEFPDLFAENEIQTGKYYITNYFCDKNTSIS